RTSNSSGDSRHHRPGSNVARDDRTRTHERTCADADAAEHYRPRADRRPALHDCSEQRPVLLRLERPRLRGRTRCLVVHEHHPVADEDLVLDRDTVADEGMALDLATGADGRPALDLDEWADTGLVTDRAAVEVGEREDGHAVAELDVEDQPERGAVGRTVIHDQTRNAPSRRRGRPLTRSCRERSVTTGTRALWLPPSETRLRRNPRRHTRGSGAAAVDSAVRRRFRGERGARPNQRDRLF